MLSTVVLTVIAGGITPDCSFSVDDEAARQTREMWRMPRSAVTPAPTGIGFAPSLSFVPVDDDPEGDMPRDVAWSPDGAQLVVVHRDTNNVTFFDAATMQHTDTVQVGVFPVDVEISGDGLFAVVPNLLSNSVSLIDMKTHELISHIPITGDEPFQVRTSADGNYAIIAVINDAVNSAFSVIDLKQQMEVASIPAPGMGSIGFFFTPETGSFGNIWSQFDITSDASRIVAPDITGDRIVVLDRATGSTVGDFPSADQPISVDISGDDTTAVVGHEGAAKTISIVDVNAPSLASTVPTSETLSAQVIRITPDKSHAIAAISNNVIFVNLTSGITTATINTGTVGDIGISHDGLLAFVSNFNARVIDIDQQSLVATIPFAACVDAAISPTELRAVALNNRFRENIHFFDLSPGSLESASVSGQPVEGDVPYAADVSADGSLVVVCNVVSGNVSIIETATNSVRSTVDVGDRPKEVRITPDGSHAVVCAMDANAVVIIDLATDEAVATLPIFNRPGRVRIAPDSSHAYVLNVAGTDRISFIELNGASSQIVAQVSAGQTGSANGPTYTENSGIELSPDGSILAVCDSFNDMLRLYDTNTNAQVASVPVGDFPIRVAFSPSGNRAYVVNHFGDSLSVVNINGGLSSLVTTIGGMNRFPITVNVDASGDYVYVGTRDAGAGTDGLRVVDVSTNSIVDTIGFSSGYPRDAVMATESDQDVLMAISTEGEFIRVYADGPASSIVDSTTLSGGAPDLAWAAGIAAVAQPVPDGVDILRLFPCPADLSGDNTVDTIDLLELLGEWGPCLTNCPADLNGDNTVDTIDLLELLGQWGVCS